MLPIRRLLRSPAIFVGAYAVGLLLWSVLAGPYAAYYRFGGNLLFGSWGRYAEVDFRAHHEKVGDGIHDGAVYLKTDVCPTARRVTLSTKYLGYAPTLLVVALTAALPFSGRRRGCALLWGLLGVNLFVALRTGIMLVDQFASVGDPCSLYLLTDSQKRLLSGIAKGLAQSPPMSYMVPVLIWALASFRRGDWEILSHIIGRSHERDAPNHSPDRDQRR